MSTFRLDTVSPDLAESFRQATPAKRRQSAVVACELAVSATGLASQTVSVALDALRAGSAPNSLLRQQLESLAADFDEQYLRMAEEAEEPAQKEEALRLFSCARAASALAFALSQDDAELHEAVYEAISAMDIPDELVQTVARALQ